MTVVLWSGYDENEKLETNEERRVPKQIWKQIFNTVYPQDSPGPWYTLSPALEERRVDPISGQSSSCLLYTSSAATWGLPTIWMSYV